MITSWLKRQSGPIGDLVRGGEAPQWTIRLQPNHREYHGVFVLFDHAERPLVQLPGRVVEWPGLPVEVYVYNPPIALRQHRHGRCLQLVEPNGRWFKLHWQRPARSFDQARAYMEQLLAESMKALD